MTVIVTRFLLEYDSVGQYCSNVLGDICVLS